MDRKINRFWVFVFSCSAAGVLLGAASSQAEINQCFTAVQPSSKCLTQDPTLKTLEGMSVGLLAGAGAAVGVTWQMFSTKE
ncbi:MAG: hypothetical protein F6K32_16405 [Desertifilum sp. SIO1I2]|nr:hypothetical protein [Desertifilum sp. SIO1I2]